MEKLSQEQKEEEMKEIFNELTEENKTVINMIAQGMQIAQNNSESEVK